MTERNVVVPPFKTAGPIVRRLCFARSIFVPIENKTFCNEKKFDEENVELNYRITNMQKDYQSPLEIRNE